MDKQIQTKDLTLRRLDQADMPQMADILTDEGIGKTYMLPDFASMQEVNNLAARMIALSGRDDRVVIGVALNGRLIGWINDVGMEDGVIELGYVLSSVYQRMGYMTQAMRALIPALFARGFRAVMAGAFEENAASIRVMEKCGMRRMDKTETIAYRGKTHECVYYILESEEQQGCGGSV